MDKSKQGEEEEEEEDEELGVWSCLASPDLQQLFQGSGKRSDSEDGFSQSEVSRQFPLLV